MPSLSNTICADCGLSMKTAKTGAFGIELFEDDNPYKIWACDLKECPKCKKQILTGFGNKPIHEHFEEGFYYKYQEIRDNPNATVIEFY